MAKIKILSMGLLVLLTSGAAIANQPSQPQFQQQQQQQPQYQQQYRQQYQQQYQQPPYQQPPYQQQPYQQQPYQQPPYQPPPYQQPPYQPPPYQQPPYQQQSCQQQSQEGFFSWTTISIILATIALVWVYLVNQKVDFTEYRMNEMGRITGNFMVYQERKNRQYEYAIQEGRREFESLNSFRNYQLRYNKDNYPGGLNNNNRALNDDNGLREIATLVTTLAPIAFKLFK